MTAGFAFGGFDTYRDFGIVDVVAFLATGTGDFHNSELSHIIIILSNFSRIGFRSAIFCSLAAFSS
jgi:hypothetical protein